MSGPFKMRGWSPFTQKPKTTSEDPDLYEGGKWKQKETPQIKINKLIKEIGFIKEDAHSSGEPLTDEQKKQIANIQKQIDNLRKTKP